MNTYYKIYLTIFLLLNCSTNKILNFDYDQFQINKSNSIDETVNLNDVYFYSINTNVIYRIGSFDCYPIIVTKKPIDTYYKVVEYKTIDFGQTIFVPINFNKQINKLLKIEKNSILSFKGVVTKNAPKYLGFSFNIYQVTDTDLPPTIVINEIL